tara:strand:+ start:676 stop:2499 length:1824 start_codon:yes stop_codon:yes gene_type:complete
MANTKITNPELFNLGDSTSATQLPVMTTTERIAMNAPITTPFNIDYLVVAGGGSGGCWGGGGGAGGYLTNYGGSTTPLTSGLNYAVVVGEGGVKPFTSFPQTTRVAVNPGEDSSIIGTGISVIADGGGGGGGMVYGSATTEFPAQNGGSGGGASAIRNATSGGSATAGQGNDGGDSPAQDPNFPGGGGGGGAFLAGGDGQSASGSPAYAAGNGGDGLASSITGTSITRAGGGGGMTYGVSVTNVSSGGTGGGGAGGRYVSSSNGYNPSQSDGEDGAANTGSGGGSASATGSGSGSQWYGGLPGGGGSGIVILRYATADVASYTATGLTPTETTVGTDTILSFTTVGTGTISFTSSTPTVTISTGEMIFNSTTDKVEYFDGTKWYGITYEVISEADLFGDGSNMFTSNFSNSTPTVVEGNGASIFASSGVIGYSSNVPNAGFGKSIMGTANIDNQIFGYSMQSGDSVTSVKTISFWVYVTKIDDDDNFVLSTNMKRQNSPNQMWQYSWDPTSGAVGPIDTFTPVSTNSWHNIVAVDEGTVMRTYLDNVSIGTINISSNILLRSTSLNLYSLSDADSRNTQFVTGYRMFDRAVTVSEVNTIFNEVPAYT